MNFFKFIELNSSELNTLSSCPHKPYSRGLQGNMVSLQHLSRLHHILRGVWKRVRV